MSGYVPHTLLAAGAPWPYDTSYAYPIEITIQMSQVLEGFRAAPLSTVRVVADMIELDIPTTHALVKQLIDENLLERMGKNTYKVIPDKGVIAVKHRKRTSGIAQYVQSHPGCTAQDIATALKRPVKSIHGKLNTLEDNNRVRHFTGMSSTSGRKVRRYEHIK